MTKKTLKIDLPVHAKLHKLLLRYKAKTYSDLLDSMCDYFEISNIKPGDFSVSQKSPNVLFSDGISRIISFIRKSESNYLKDILKYSEKLVVQQSQILEKLDTKKDDFEPLDTPPKSIEIITESQPEINVDELNNLRSSNESLRFKLKHQSKIFDEFINKLSKSTFNNNWNISNDDFQYYKSEINKLKSDH